MYSVGLPVSDELTKRAAFALSYSEDAAISGVAAVEARSFTRFTADVTLIETPAYVRAGVPADIRLLRSDAFERGHVRTVHGARMTSLPWTIARLGAQLNAAQICHVIHQACWRGRLRIEELEALTSEHTTWRGHGVVASAIRMYRSGSAGTRSFLEDDFVAIFERVAGWTPLINLHIDAGWQSIEVDIPLPERGLCLEIDGPPHDEPPQQAQDRARDAQLNVVGLRVERFHWRAIRFDVSACERRLAKLLHAH